MSGICSSLLTALSLMHHAAVEDHLTRAQQALHTKEQESYITLHTLVFQGVFKTNVFPNAGLWLVARPSPAVIYEFRNRKKCSHSHLEWRNTVSYKSLLLIRARTEERKYSFNDWEAVGEERHWHFLPWGLLVVIIWLFVPYISEVQHARACFR